MGQVAVDRFVMAVDSGVIVNPLTPGAQIEGGMTQAFDYVVSEEMRYDEKGSAIDRYHIFRAHEIPELTTHTRKSMECAKAVTIPKDYYHQTLHFINNFLSCLVKLSVQA